MNSATETGDQGNAGQIAYWNDQAAATWKELQTRLDALFISLTDFALDAAAPVAGERVVDIGCGCGATVLALADRVGPTGHVLGVDVSAPMAARAAQRIAAAGLQQAEVLVSDASIHPFELGRADLLFSRFGVMFFADPVGAFANLRLAVRPGGRALFVAWRAFDQNPWFFVPVQAAAGLLPAMPPVDPNAPGPFAFADPKRVAGILAKAGWTDISITPQDVPLRLSGPGQLDEAVEFVTRLGPLALGLADADAALKARVAAAVGDVLRSHDGPQGIVLTGAIWLIDARGGSPV